MQALDIIKGEQQKNKRNNPPARMVCFPWDTKHLFPIDLQSQITLSTLRKPLSLLLKLLSALG